MTPSVQVAGIGKCYKHYARPSHRLWEWAGFGARERHLKHWVLSDVTFSAEPGEAVGIVGVNGAGKSTLLKIIKGTVRPSSGRVACAGRVAALELGLGFHPDFDGRENAITAGALLGLDGPTMRSLMPEIEAFAEIGGAIGDPVRTYSSGMQLRLAFAVATAVRPEILMIDEALAVGDAYFQQKCVGRIRRFREQGTTLLFASHDPGAVRTLCDRALLLDAGRLVREGEPVSVLDYYNAMIARRTAEYEIRTVEAPGAHPSSTRSGDQRATIETASLRDESGDVRVVQVGADVTVRIEGRVRERIDGLTVGISIRDRLGNEVFGTNTHHARLAGPSLRPGGAFRAEFGFAMNLGCGTYTLTTALHAGSVHLEGNYDWWDKVLVFQVVPGDEPTFVGCTYLPTTVRFEAIE
jgi:lipopolysaccharide transport system ATP-binding protein